ncbi:sugar phosphate isomerase/epimerase [Kineococcus glutinatus]|uniref:Sugar phosphate isomerase/epimerase n=1 Tax=Kineococcus glutinatus TaxID=1070872 RepID=A0ABP9H8V5_9ACTN
MQLYTVREQLADDVSGTLKRLAEVGFTQVEPFALTDFADRLGPALQENGLSAPTTHQSFVGSSDADLAAVFATASRLGVGTVVDPFVAPERWGARSDVEEVAAQLNAAARVAADHGVRVGYHNHAHELESVLAGTTALEVLAGALDDAVALEVDTYWVAVGRQDPVALLRRLGERVVALHVKDGPVTKDNLDQVAVGRGSMPVRDIVEAAPQALRVVELDDSRGDRFQAVADSFAYLSAQGLA